MLETLVPLLRKMFSNFGSYTSELDASSYDKRGNAEICVMVKHNTGVLHKCQLCNYGSSEIGVLQTWTFFVHLSLKKECHQRKPKQSQVFSARRHSTSNHHLHLNEKQNVCFKIIMGSQCTESCRPHLKLHSFLPAFSKEESNKIDYFRKGRNGMVPSKDNILRCL